MSDSTAVADAETDVRCRHATAAASAGWLHDAGRCGSYHNALRIVTTCCSKWRVCVCIHMLMAQSLQPLQAQVAQAEVALRCAAPGVHLVGGRARTARDLPAAAASGRRRRHGRVGGHIAKGRARRRS